MAESACLVHSFSYAATLSHESHEDNPLHALSQSISFGRFMTESLEWGKWSSFSHKKYVEEAEKFSKPGSVAQKKAFFEAHYKKIAAAKKAAADESPEERASNATESPNASPVKKPEVKEQINETGLVSGADGSGLNVEKGNETERKSGQIDDSVSAEKAATEENLTRVGSLNKPVVTEDDDKTIDLTVNDAIERKENYMEVDSLKKNGLVGKKDADGELLKKNGSVGKKSGDGELLKKNESVGNKDEGRESITRNSFRMSKKTSGPLETPDLSAKHSLSQKRSERIACDSVKTDEKSVHRRFSLLNCLLTQSKTQDQDMTKKEEKPKKKLNKPFWCLCFKPQVLGETETPKNQMKRVQTNIQSPKLWN